MEAHAAGDGDAVPPTLAVVRDLEAELLEPCERELGVVLLGLLEAEDVGVVLVDPAGDSIPACRERVHVPRRDPHPASSPALTTTKSSSASQQRSPSTVAVPVPRPARRERRDKNDLELEGLAGHHLASEPSSVDAAEERQAAAIALVHEERGRAELGHRLDEQHPGHGGAAREVALEERLVLAHVPPAGRALPGRDGRHLGEQEEGSSVRQDEHRIEGGDELGPVAAPHRRGPVLAGGSSIRHAANLPRPPGAGRRLRDVQPAATPGRAKPDN